MVYSNTEDILIKNEDSMIKDLKKDTHFAGKLLLANQAVKISKTSKEYMDLTFRDRSGELNGKIWNVDEHLKKSLEDANVVFVKGNVEEYNSNLQLRVETIEKTTADEAEMAQLVASAPYSATAMYKKIMEIIEGMQNEDLKKLCKTIYERYKDELLYYSAAKSFHHNYKAGLLHHIYTMLRSSMGLTEIYNFMNRDLVQSGVLLHDIGKLFELSCNKLGIVDEYTKEGKLLGHIIQSICIIDQFSVQLNIDSEISLLLKHMLLTHHYYAEFGSPKMPMFPEAELLHYLDVLDAKMNQMEFAVGSVEEGAFTGNMPSLERRNIYHHKLTPQKE